jgi:hypothetical protein
MKNPYVFHQKMLCTYVYESGKTQTEMAGRSAEMVYKNSWRIDGSKRKII